MIQCTTHIAQYMFFSLLYSVGILSCSIHVRTREQAERTPASPPPTLPSCPVFAVPDEARLLAVTRQPQSVPLLGCGAKPRLSPCGEWLALPAPCRRLLADGPPGGALRARLRCDGSWHPQREGRALGEQGQARGQRFLAGTQKGSFWPNYYLFWGWGMPPRSGIRAPMT